MSEQESWWAVSVEVDRVHGMLARASVLPASEAAYYRSKPWKWSTEREWGDRMEALMRRAGVDPREGWDMTAGDLLRAYQRSTSSFGNAPAESRRGEP